MKQVAFMNTPFDGAELAQLAALAEQYGYACLYPEKDAPEDCLRDTEILMGYFPHRMLRHAQSLRWLALPSAGADKYVGDHYPHNDFVLTNSSGAFGAAIAEQLVMGALMLLRDMPGYEKQQREKLWQRRGQLRFLSESTVLIVGTGNLGSTFAGYIAPMGAEVIGVSRSGKSVHPAFSQVYPVSELSGVLPRADVVALCLPATGETVGLFDREMLLRMKKGSILLNVGRGKTVVTEDLIHALSTGHLAGAMLDVVEPEPLPPESPLWEMENVILTPHISGSDLDRGNTGKIFSIFYENLSRYLEGKPLTNIVDRTKGY